jgi:hypothetical protein
MSEMMNLFYFRLTKAIIASPDITSPVLWALRACFSWDDRKSVKGARNTLINTIRTFLFTVSPTWADNALRSVGERIKSPNRAKFADSVDDLHSKSTSQLQVRDFYRKIQKIYFNNEVTTGKVGT